MLAVEALFDDELISMAHEFACRAIHKGIERTNNNRTAEPKPG